jgi:hypothetical protein
MIIINLQYLSVPLYILAVYFLIKCAKWLPALYNDKSFTRILLIHNIISDLTKSVCCSALGWLIWKAFKI